MAFEQTTLPHLHFTELHKVLINENIQDACIGKVNERGQKCGTGHRFFTARCQDSQSIAQNGATDTEAQGINFLGTRDVLNLADGFDGGIFNVVIPRLLRHAFIGVAPADHKGAVALTDCIPNEGVVGLQIKDVKLVDTRRHQQKWFFVNLGRERFVLNQLKIFIFKNHSAFGGGHVLTHHKFTFVCHGHMTLLHVMQQVLNTLGKTLTLSVNGFLLRFCIEG